MNSEVDFSRDEHFLRLLARKPCSLTMINLEIARDAYPELDFAKTLDWFDQRRQELTGHFRGMHSEQEQLETLARSISMDHEVTGSEAAYRTADGSFLNRVIETGQGIPISLSLLYMEVAGQLGLTLSGVSSPLHFLTMAETVTGRLFLDAYSGGRLLTEEETVGWLCDLTRMRPDQVERSLLPADDRTIVIRMLNNLCTLYASNEDWSSAWTVQNRLVAISPASYPLRRDLALIAFKAQHSATAARLLKSLLNTCPDEDREFLTSQLEQAQRDIPRWN
ncbi:MAG: transglutaminase-like domain-containing protein [Planctomycetota bacterium]|nr:transglutaminase-like domain-containing protein [Planctomycetota bacterium]MDA0919089.1 transglutaminase-like domain-containing protein [Planctomycetota bacterium]MDA1161379.1 transglutaminase-like domain-containing protein [Planctomycetota bacterium]